MRLLLVASLLPLASAFFFATIPNNAYARPPEAGPAPPCNCDPPTFPPLPTFAPLVLPTLGPLPTLPPAEPLPTLAPFVWPTLPPAPAQAAAAQGYVQPPKPLELPTLAPLEPLPTMAPIEFPTLPPFKAPDAYVQPKPLELPTLPPLEPLPTLAPFVMPTFAPLPPAPEYILPTLPPFQFPKLPDTYVQPPQPVEVATLAPLVLPTFPPLEPLPTMAPIEFPTLPPFETPKIPDAYVQPKPLEFPTLPPFKAPEPVYIQPIEFPTFAPLAPLPTLAPFEWPTFAPLVAPAEGYATAPPQYVVPQAPKVTNDIVTESGAVGGVEEAAPALPVEPVEAKTNVAVDNAEASTADEEVAPPPESPKVPEGVTRPEIPSGTEEVAPFVQTNVISDADLVENEHPKTFEDAVVTSNKLRLRRGSPRHLEGIRRIVL